MRRRKARRPPRGGWRNGWGCRDTVPRTVSPSRKREIRFSIGRNAATNLASPARSFASNSTASYPGIARLRDAYGLRFAGMTPYSPTFMYRALGSGRADVISALFSIGRNAATNLASPARSFASNSTASYPGIARFGWAAVRDAYGLRFAGMTPYSPTFMYRALGSGRADVLSRCPASIAVRPAPDR
jgi:hypothetical protein